MKALAKNPELRYQAAHEFIEDLNRATNMTGNAEPYVVAPLTPTEAGNNNLWKTAFVVLAGISLLAVGLIYATSTKQTDPTTTTNLQSDANGQPVQPLNPATGMNEQGTAGLIPYQTGQLPGNSNMMPMPNGMPQPIPNGDGFGDGKNYWGGNGPPPGAPPMPPSGQMYMIPGDGSSQFMPPDGVILVPVPVNANVKTVTPNGKIPNANVNANAAPAPTPAANTSPIR